MGGLRQVRASMARWLAGNWFRSGGHYAGAGSQFYQNRVNGTDLRAALARRLSTI
jgi:hypothetical protein